MGSPGAAAYVRSRGRLRGGRLRRLLMGSRRRVHDLLRGRVGSPICAIARCSSAPQSAERGPAAWLREGWTEWSSAPCLPRRTLLVTGGPRTVSKVVLLAFEEPSPVPAIAVKAPRVDEAAAGVRREGVALARLAACRSGGIPGVPRLLIRREIDGVRLLVETALRGRPLESLLTPRSHGAWSMKVADWLAARAGRGRAPRALTSGREGDRRADALPVRGNV